jgi:hypothetical protein
MNMDAHSIAVGQSRDVRSLKDLPQDALKAFIQDMKTVNTDYQDINRDHYPVEDSKRFSQIFGFIYAQAPDISVISSGSGKMHVDSRKRQAVNYFAALQPEDRQLEIEVAIDSMRKHLSSKAKEYRPGIDERLAAAWDEGRIGDQTFPPLKQLFTKSMEDAIQQSQSQGRF